MWFIKATITIFGITQTYWVFTEADKSRPNLFGFYVTVDARYAEAFKSSEVIDIQERVQMMLPSAHVETVECRMCDELRKVMQR